MGKYLVYLAIILGVVGVSYAIYDYCKERDPARVGTIENQLYNQCLNHYRTCTNSYNSSTKTTSQNCTTHCSAYMCQEHTVKIGKHAWNDETLAIKDLYHGSCRTTGGGW